MEDGGNVRSAPSVFSYRGIDLDNLVDMQNEDLMGLFRARQRRKFSRGIKRQPITLLKTHMRNMVIVPEMIGSVVGVYNGKNFINVEVKPEMIGHYLAEFSITYHPVQHGRGGKG